MSASGAPRLSSPSRLAPSRRSRSLAGFAAALFAVPALLLFVAAPAAAQSDVPGAPTGLTVTDGHRAVELHWTAPADDGGSPITGYEIEGSGLYATGITSTSYIVDTGEFDGIVFLRVRAVNANGNGAWSDNWLGEVRSATVTIAGGSDVLEGQEAEFILTADRPVLSTSRPLNVSVLVSGQQHHLEDGTQSLGVKTVSFGLNATTAAHSVQTRQDYAATGDSDLTAAIQTSTDYTVGNPSSATVKITERDLVPDPPTDLVVTHTHFDVDLSWTAPAFPGTHGSPIWYEIDLGELRSSIRNVAGTSQKELFSRINVVYSASIRVRATNAYGEGEWSDQVLVTLRGAAITIAGNGPVTEGSDAVFTLTTDLVNRQKINVINTLAVNVLVSETDDMVASTAEKVYTVRFADDATTATLTVPTVDNDRDERDSVVTATIQPSTETTLVETYETGSPASATVTVANDDVGNFERRRLESCGVSAPHSSGHAIECFQLVNSSYVRTPEGMAARGYAPIGIKQPEVGDIVAMEGLPDDWVINVLGEKVDAAVVTIAAGTSPVTEGANVMFTVTRATATATHLSVTVGVAETQRMIFNGVPAGIDSVRWPTRVDILANATDATFLVVTDDDDVDEADSVITATVNAGNGYTVGTSASASVTVNDNDGTAPAQVLVTVGTPEDVAATAAGSSRIDLSWTAPEGEPAGYNVNWSPDGQPGTWRPVDPAHDGAATGYSHTGLTAETAYHYRVRAVNRDGPGEWSAVAGAATDATQQPPQGAEPPATPGTVAASASGQSRIEVSWSAPDGEVTGYEVEWSAGGSGSWTAADPAHSGTAAGYSDTGLDAGTTRHYRVRTVNDAGSGEWSGPASATTERPELTARFEQATAVHEGRGSTFSVRLVFSEAVTSSYRTLRDTAVQADHGRVRKAKRVNGSSAEWKITVAPSSDEAVTVTLSPGNGACG